MKELSIEQKAQRYDKAIKRANELNYVSDKDSLQRKTVEHIFPELKESEDEKIRKTLRERIIRYDPNNEILIKEEGISQKQFLAWLEKQGEQNLNAWTEGDEKQARQIERIVHNDGCSKKLQEQIANWFKSIKYRVQPQPQQEWNEEDERNASYICAALDCYYRLREDKNNTNGQEDLDKARNWLYNKLKSLSPQNKWKPSGWSEDKVK